MNLDDLIQQHRDCYFCYKNYKGANFKCEAYHPMHRLGDCVYYKALQIDIERFKKGEDCVVYQKLAQLIAQEEVKT